MISSFVKQVKPAPNCLTLGLVLICAVVLATDLLDMLPPVLYSLTTNRTIQSGRTFMRSSLLLLLIISI